MKSHAFRPLLAIIILMTVGLAARSFVVPRDFGIGERGYMYAWHRKGNEAEWKAEKARYQPKGSCTECHEDNAKSLARSPHAVINCQACHGPALDHPTQPEKLPINRERALCIRCHAALPYPRSARAHIKGIDPATHNPDAACVDCHNPHQPIETGGVS